MVERNSRVSAAGNVGSFPSLTAYLAGRYLPQQFQKERGHCFDRRLASAVKEKVVIDMTHAALAPLIGSEFDEFLSASIGEDRNGTGLSVLSALARLDVRSQQRFREPLIGSLGGVFLSHVLPKTALLGASSKTATPCLRHWLARRSR
jgi:hypothetical protein